ncbi:MAG: hypothetical protein ACKOEZ_03085, partial [Spartobacteria bacterium]
SDPGHAAVLAEMRARLARWMKETGDPLLSGRIDPKPGMIVRAGDEDLPHGKHVPAEPIIVESRD